MSLSLSEDDDKKKKTKKMKSKFVKKLEIFFSNFFKLFKLTKKIKPKKSSSNDPNQIDCWFCGNTSHPKREMFCACKRCQHDLDCKKDNMHFHCIDACKFVMEQWKYHENKEIRCMNMDHPITRGHLYDCIRHNDELRILYGTIESFHKNEVQENENFEGKNKVDNNNNKKNEMIQNDSKLKDDEEEYSDDSDEDNIILKSKIPNKLNGDDKTGVYIQKDTALFSSMNDFKSNGNEKLFNTTELNEIINNKTTSIPLHNKSNNNNDDSEDDSEEEEIDDFFKGMTKRKANEVSVISIPKSKNNVTVKTKHGEELLKSLNDNENKKIQKKKKLLRKEGKLHVDSPGFQIENVFNI